MFRILLTRRWVILTLVFFVLIPVMYWLGVWQFHRYQQTKVGNQQISANQAAKPVPMESLSQPGGNVPSDLTYRGVTATGHYDTAHEFVVRHRTDAAGDNIGFYVITPLDLADGKVVLVNRGWVQPGNNSGAEYPTVPGAPSGTVSVEGRLRPDETSAATGIRDVKGLPDRQFMLIDSAEQAARIPQPVLAGYLELVSTSPAAPAADSAELVPGPNQSSDSMAVVGKGVHLPYALQWWLFAALVPIGWVVLLRRDIRDRRRQDALAAKAADAPDPTPEPTPDLTPDLTADLAPGLAADLTPDLTKDAPTTAVAAPAGVPGE
ncbi:SURF1 family protein [Streptacidiphilus sp. EB129]|uniref:SURF1 family cytochrome oxidase biogenesis protein n=1 Tax=Streptacidiphilus sp. EB129 TaxID=3156262 RepID=UPI003511A53C